MSKYVKYISSSHYGTPPLKGDRYGYFVELLRSCLCNGFNANDSIISIETIDLINKKISITFNDPHTYSVDQTLLIENIQDFQFNGEYKIIEIIDMTYRIRSSSKSLNNCFKKKTYIIF